MIKSVLAALSLAAVVSTLGCSAAPDADPSMSDQALSDQAAGKTLTLAQAESQIATIRAKYEPNESHALLLDPSLAPDYLNDVAPVFARTAKKDLIDLGGDAFTYVSTQVSDGAIFDKAFFDTAVASYQQLWDFTFYWGDPSTNPELWTKLQGLITRSTAGTLTDLQIVELVSNGRSGDILTGLTSLHWSSATAATSVTASGYIDIEGAFDKLYTAVLGGQDSTAHDIDLTDPFAVSVYKRSVTELRTLPTDEAGEILIDLGGHLASNHDYNEKESTNAIALTKTLLTASELKVVSQYLR